MATLDLTTNRRVTSLTGVSDATILTQLYSQTVMRTLRGKNLLLDLCNNQYEERLRKVQSIEIPVDTTALTVKEDHSLAVTDTGVGVYPTSGRGRPTVKMRTLAWPPPTENLWVGGDISRQQMREAPIDMVVEFAINRATAVSEVINRRVYDAWTKVDLSAVENDFRVGATDATKDQKDFVGSSTDYVPYDGVEQGDGNIVFSELDKLDLILQQTYKSGADSMEDFIFDVVLPPHLFKSLNRTLEAKNIPTLVMEYIEGRPRNRLFGRFQFTVTNALTQKRISESTEKVVASGGKKAYPMIILTRRATTRATDFESLQLLDPATNQASSNWKFDWEMQLLVEVIDPRWMNIIWVPMEARSQ